MVYHTFRGSHGHQHDSVDERITQLRTVQQVAADEIGAFRPPPIPKMGLEETLALTPALSPRRGRSTHSSRNFHAVELLHRNLRRRYANPNASATVCIAAMTCVMCSSSGRPSNSAPFSISSRFTAAANDFCFIFFLTLLAVMPASFSGRT